MSKANIRSNFGIADDTFLSPNESVFGPVDEVSLGPENYKSVVSSRRVVRRGPVLAGRSERSRLTAWNVTKIDNFSIV